MRDALVFSSCSPRIPLVFTLCLPGAPCAIPRRVHRAHPKLGLHWAGRYSNDIAFFCESAFPGCASISPRHTKGLEGSEPLFYAQTFQKDAVPSGLVPFLSRLSGLTRVGSLVCSRALLTEWFLARRESGYRLAGYELD